MTTATAGGAESAVDTMARVEVLAVTKESRRRRWDISLTLAILVLLAVLLFAIAPQLFSPYSPYAVGDAARLSNPSLSHLFGTDTLGRDIFSRFVWGTRTTLVAGILALAIGFVSASVLGLLAGYLGGVVDEVISRIVDIFLAVPGLLVALMLVTGLGFGTVNIGIAVGVSSVAAFTRVLRSEVLRVRNSDFVTSAKLTAVPWYVILVRHVFPHAIGPVLALTAIQLGGAIIAISSLSFLGFGAQAPTPEWGNILSSGQDVLSFAWWISVLPGASIVLVVLATNRVSRYLEGIR